MSALDKKSDRSMTRAELVEFLRCIASQIEEGDSCGGTIKYNSIGIVDGGYELDAAIRCGTNGVKDGFGGLNFYVCNPPKRGD